MTDSAKPERRGIVERALNVVSDVRSGESKTALLLLSTIFVLLLSYYVLKTVREPLVLASAEADLQLVQHTTWPQWLKDILLAQEGPQLKALAAGFQALFLAGFVPVYSWIASKIARTQLIVGVTIFFICGIESFFVLRLLNVPMLGFVFFIWVGVFSVAMVAQFWSFANDLYTEEQGRRLFPLIGIGATAGSPVGSKCAKWLYEYLAPDPGTPLDGIQSWIQAHQLDPSFILLQLPAIGLVIFGILMMWVSRRESEPRAEASDQRSKKGGFRLILQSPYVRLIALVILVLNLVNSMGEFLLSDVVTHAADAAVAAHQTSSKGAWIGQFYGDYFFYVNVTAFLLQALVVSRIAKYTGLAGVVLALPIVALGTYGLFAAGLGLFALRFAKTAENATDYSIMNTGKAMVWLPTSRSAKYKGKQAVDTFVVRIGDMIASILFVVGSTNLHFGRTTFALINLGLVGVWLLFTFLLLRQHKKIEAEPASDPATQ